MVDTKGQPAEPNTNLHLKKGRQKQRMWFSHLTGGTVENKIVNQLIIPTTGLPTYCQVVNTTIITVDEFEEGIIDSGASGHYGERKAKPYYSEVLDPLTPTHSKLKMAKTCKLPDK